jgi:hypothetical protein
LFARADRLGTQDLVIEKSSWWRLARKNDIGQGRIKDYTRGSKTNTDLAHSFEQECSTKGVTQI